MTMGVLERGVAVAAVDGDGGNGAMTVPARMPRSRVPRVSNPGIVMAGALMLVTMPVMGMLIGMSTVANEFDWYCVMV